MESITAQLQALKSLIPERSALLEQLEGNPDLGSAFEQLMDECMDDYYTSHYQDCSSNGKMLLDIIWEKLNTGHWKDVSIVWRYAYTVISLVKGVSEFDFWCNDNQNSSTELKAMTKLKDILKTFDMGLLMGAPLIDNVLAKCASKLQRIIWEIEIKVKDDSKDVLMKCTDEKFQDDDDDSSSFNKIYAKRSQSPSNEPSDRKKTKTAEKSEIIANQSRQISRVSCPSLQTFKTNYMDVECPVVIVNMMEHWPALSSRKWTMDYLKEVAGYRTVPIEIGSKYTDESWSQKLMTVSEFIADFIQCIGESESNYGSQDKGSRPVGYLAQHQLFDQIPELLDDISIPTYCCLGENEDVDMNVWFGPGGTVSPLHYDPKHNFLAQVFGRKYLRLYSYDVTSRLYPHEDFLLCNTSRVDVQKPDLETFPEFANAPYTECILDPGDILYLPPKYWHYVKSLSVSFSVSFWFE